MFCEQREYRGREIQFRFHRVKKHFQWVRKTIGFDKRTLFKVLCCSDPYLIKLEQSLRSFCLMLHSSIGYLKPLPADANFSIFIHTTEQASTECMENPMFEVVYKYWLIFIGDFDCLFSLQNFPWIVIDSMNDLLDRSDIIPVHTTDLDSMKLQVYIKTKAR